MLTGSSIGPCRWIQTSTGPTSTEPTLPVPQGELPDYKKLFAKPADHAVGRSRGGLSARIHHACDGKGRPLAMIMGPDQGGDSPMFSIVMGRGSGPATRWQQAQNNAGRREGRQGILVGPTGQCCTTAASRPLYRSLRIDRAPETPRFTRRTARELRRSGPQRPQQR